ncbi:MAG: phage tail protein [Synechococcaceae cyanobacterium]
MALPCAQLWGRPMWARCDHDGTRIGGEPAAVRLAPLPPPQDGSGEGNSGGAAESLWASAWESRRGSAVLLPCGPAACAERQVVLLDPQAGLLVLEPQGWARLRPAAVDAPAAPAGAEPRFQPPAPAAPDPPEGLALDPWQGLWLLERAAGALRRLDADGRVVASVPLPPGLRPQRFGCTARGLVIAIPGETDGPALLFRPWQGEWRGLRLALPPQAESSSQAVELIDLAADPSIPWAVALIRQGPRHGLVVWDGRRRRSWLAPMLRRPRHLLIDGPQSVLVSEPPWLPGDSRPTPFQRLVLHPSELEEEGSWRVRGFDGRGLWREGDTVWASTAAGAQALLAVERPLRSEGRIETWALDSGSFACRWHRLFVDVCLPPGTGLWVEARSADDLPPWEVRRGARSPQDTRGDAAPLPPPPPLDDPWPPLASRSPDDNEGWQRLAMPDRRPPLIDQPLERPAPGQGGMETLEWLVSTPPGRYLWLRLHLEGDGRRSPVLVSLRVSQPRPALLERLPAFWRADPEGADLSERLLALFEGPLTELEHRAEALRRLFLPAQAPAEALPWLAGFLALTYHDHVPLRVRRRLLAQIATLYRQRGTRPGLERLLSILAEADVVILEGFLQRRRSAAFLGPETVLGPALELGGREGLLGGDPLALDPLAIAARGDDEQRMALAHGILLAHRQSVRGAGGEPCPGREPPSPVAADPLRAWYRQQAHRFTVLLPLERTTELEAVLQQALELHKPAHTLHQLCWLEAGLCLERGVLVGLHRLGASPRAAPPVLGQALLGGGTDPLGGAATSDPCGPGLAVLPFLPLRSRQP